MNNENLCDETILPIHQLSKLNDEQNFDIFPISVIQAIFDKTGVRLDAILNSFNYIFLSYAGSKEATRLQVPFILRRKSLVVCYRDMNDDNVIEMHNSDYKSDDKWKDDENWVNFEDYLKSLADESYKDYIDIQINESLIIL